ncbi:MAG: HAMP domain-containing protein, partial [Candidatus Limnocylindrales bacterium]
MPRGLAGRIALAFVGLSLAVILALGGTLFLVLRGLHQSATQDALANVSVGLVVQRARALVAANAQDTLLAIQDALAQRDISVGLFLADGRLVALEGDAPLPLGTPRIDLTGARGATHKGTFGGPDGTAYDYAVTNLRAAGGIGPRALIVASPDRSRAQALADLLTALPAVALVLLLVGLPIGWLLARSVARPLRRLAQATADLPAAGTAEGAATLPLQGPTEVRELTQRFNAM